MPRHQNPHAKLKKELALLFTLSFSSISVPWLICTSVQKTDFNDSERRYLILAAMFTLLIDIFIIIELEKLWKLKKPLHSYIISYMIKYKLRITDTLTNEKQTQIIVKEKRVETVRKIDKNNTGININKRKARRTKQVKEKPSTPSNPDHYDDAPSDNPPSDNPPPDDKPVTSEHHGSAHGSVEPGYSASDEIFGTHMHHDGVRNGVEPGYSVHDDKHSISPINSADQPHYETEEEKINTLVSQLNLDITEKCNLNLKFHELVRRMTEQFPDILIVAHGSSVDGSPLNISLARDIDLLIFPGEENKTKSIDSLIEESKALEMNIDLVKESDNWKSFKGRFLDITVLFGISFEQYRLELPFSTDYRYYEILSGDMLPPPPLQTKVTVINKDYFNVKESNQHVIMKKSLLLLKYIARLKANNETLSQEVIDTFNDIINKINLFTYDKYNTALWYATMQSNNQFIRQYLGGYLGECLKFLRRNNMVELGLFSRVTCAAHEISRTRTSTCS